MSVTLDLVVGTSPDGNVVAYTIFTNNSDEMVQLHGTPPSSNPIVKDSEGYTYTMSMGYTQERTTMRIGPGNSVFLRQKYPTPDERKEREGPHDRTEVYDPRERDVDNSEEWFFASIDPSWERTLTFETEYSCDGQTISAETTVYLPELEERSREDIKSELQTDSEDGFRR